MPALPSLGGLRGRGNGRAARVEPPIPVPVSAYVVDCAVYVDGKRLPGRWAHAEAIKEVRKRREGFVWIGLHEPDSEQIQGIAEAYGLHELAVEDAVQAHQRPKLERYDDSLFMVLKTLRYVEHESPTTANEIVETGELMAFLGLDFIITVPTMLAGIEGMNFQYMPELTWKFGYPLVLLIIFGVCLLLYRIFRKNKWL